MEEKERPQLENEGWQFFESQQSRFMFTKRNAVNSIIIRRIVWQWTAPHRKAQRTGLIALLLAHFRPQLKSHHTAGVKKKKRRAQELKRPLCVRNDIRHGPIEDLPMTFKVSSPLPLENHRKQSHLQLWFGCN